MCNEHDYQRFINRKSRQEYTNYSSLGTPTFINTSFNDSKDSKKSDSDSHILKIKGYLRVALDYLKKQILTDL